MLEKLSSIISGRGGADEAVAFPRALPEPLRSVETSFDRVKSIEECIDLLESSSILTAGQIDSEALGFLQHQCDEMRKRGLGLEPNLLSRALVRCLVDPVAAGEWCIKFAATDDDWRHFVSGADRARDSGTLHEAEYLYHRALDLYPAHYGILIQYAHCLKDQGKRQDALAYYLDARIAGGARAEIEEHARFVARAMGVEDRTVAFLSSRKSIPFSRDIRAIHRLFLDEEPSVSRIVELLLQNETTAEVVRDIIADPTFSDRNKDFLRYLSEVSWGK